MRTRIGSGQGARQRQRRYLTCAAALALLIVSSVDPSAAAEGSDPHGGRLEFVGALIEQSSAAKRIAASANPDAQARRALARDLHRQAVSAHKAGDHARADQLLAQSTQLMFEAVRLAESASDSMAKKGRDFDNRLASVEALAAAFGRICEEKKCEASMKDAVLHNVREKVVQAGSLRASGDVDGARARLDDAYVAVKAAIEHQRSGDTLVRSLNFATKEEEYRYEIDRNDTHRMLITLLLEDKERSAAMGGRLRKQLDDAGALRAQAEREAAAGSFEAAVRSLEASTRELQRALRGAGIYIPG